MENLRTSLVVLLLLFFVMLAGCDNTEAGSKVPNGSLPGQVAADFTLTDMSGKQVSLSQFKGKVVLLNFWGTFCPPCREEMPSMERLYNNFRDKGFVILAVNIEVDGRQKVSKFLQQNPYTFPILLDDKNVAAQQYGVFRFPESFLIDRNGNVVEKIIGGRDWLSGPTFEKIKFLLEG